MSAASKKNYRKKPVASDDEDGIGETNGNGGEHGNERYFLVLKPTSSVAQSLEIGQ